MSWQAKWSDDFTRADNTTLGSGWTVDSNTSPNSAFRISSNRAYIIWQTGSSGTVPLRAYLNAGTLADMKVEVTATTGNITPWARAHIIARRTASTTYYLAYYGGASVGAANCSVYKVVSGTFTLLATSSPNFSYTSPASLGMSAKGTTIAAFHDGVEKVSVTDSGISASGYAGIYQALSSGENYYLDNFTVSEWVEATSKPYFFRTFVLRRP